MAPGRKKAAVRKRAAERASTRRTIVKRARTVRTPREAARPAAQVSAAPGKRLAITEVALRDGHQCLLATRMRTEDMLPIAAKMDQIGYWSLEVWGGATFDTCLRYLKEDPWERLRALRAAMPNSKLQMLLRGQNIVGYRHYADDVLDKFIERSAVNGIDIFRIFDALNDVRNMERAMREVKANGKHVEAAISYTVSPVHTLQGFIDLGKQLEDMGTDTLCVKDMAGLLAPWDAYAISPMAGGASHSPTESLVAALRGTPYDTGLDLRQFEPISEHFREVRKKYHQFESDFTGVDAEILTSQVPGGMLSNLAAQLAQQNALDRMRDVLEEIPQVRKDMGFPPLVTPSSQIVGTQATLNILTGERYKVITSETKNYFLGLYGKPPGTLNPEVQARAIGDEEPVKGRPADRLEPELEAARKELGEKVTSEEDVLSFALFPPVARQFFEERERGELKPEQLETPPEKGPAVAHELHLAPVDFNVTVHGESYHIQVSGSGRKSDGRKPYYIRVNDKLEEVYLEPIQEVLAGVPEAQDTGSKSGPKRPRPTLPGDIAPPMPGRVVKVLVAKGDTVKAGDPVLIIEAMKMESRVPAPISGTVTAVYVKDGDDVKTEETLIRLE
jgi:pyruvate carboxylase subunit B